MGAEAHRVVYFWHMIGNSFLTLLSNMCTNLNLTDMKTCYKLFRREILQQITIEEDRFGFEPEITAKVSRLKECRIYEVGISYSNRFKKLMPIVFDVPGFSGIRIHSGNTEEDTEGCPLVGLSRSTDTVLQSRIAYNRFFEWLEKTLKTEKVFLNVVKV